MRCTNCRKNIDTNAIFCEHCGKATDLLDKDLAYSFAKQKVNNELNDKKSHYFQVAILLFFFPFLAIIASVYFLHANYLWLNISMLVLIPFLLIPFSNKGGLLNQKYRPKHYFRDLKNYPKFFVFVLLNVLYFFLLKLICTGKPFFTYAYDPILNLVQQVMIFYWLSVMIIAPTVMIQRKVSPLKALIMSYKASKETRWQQFYVFFNFLIAIGLGLISFGFYWIKSFPKAIAITEKYYFQMEKRKLFDSSSS